MIDLEERLQSAGVKLTSQRKAIVRALVQSDDHPTVELVYQRARDLDASVSIATVYRTLSLLDELNLVQRHEFNEKQARFEANLAEHHHLVDVETGAVHEFQSRDLRLMLAKIAEQLDYDVVDVNVEIYAKKGR